MGLFGSDPYRDAYREQRRMLNAQARAYARNAAEVDFALRGYDDNFFNQRAKEYANQGLQAVHESYSRSIEAAAKALASRGIDSSSMADRLYGELARANVQQRNRVATDAWRQAFIADRGEIERRRQALYGMAGQATSMLGAASEASVLGRAVYNPTSGIGEAFMGAFQAALPGIYAQMMGYPGFRNLRFY